MRTVDEILDQFRRLSSGQRRELLDRLSGFEGQVKGFEKRPRAYARTLGLAGTGRSAFTNVAGDKYEHLAEAYADEHE